MNPHTMCSLTNVLFILDFFHVSYSSTVYYRDWAGPYSKTRAFANLMLNAKDVFSYDCKELHMNLSVFVSILKGIGEGE